MDLLKTTYFIGYDGLQLAADVGGDSGNPPVILLHGGGQTRHSWGQAARELVQAGLHVISLDLRGHGDSAWAPNGDYALSSFAEDLRCVIATLTQPPVLVGASLGGVTSMIAIGEAERPLARALVLVDVVPHMRPEGVEHIRNFMTANLGGFSNLDEAADAVARYLPGRERARNHDGLMKNLRHKDDGRLYWHWDPAFMAESIEPSTLSARLDRCADRIRIPTLLVRGTQSDVVGQDSAKALLALMPHAQYVDVQGAGHMVAGDKNDAFNREIERFLREL